MTDKERDKILLFIRDLLVCIVGCAIGLAVHYL